MIEAERSSIELSDLGINNQLLIINGVLCEASDPVSQHILDNQRKAMESMPGTLREFETFTIPLRSYNILGLEKIRAFLKSDNYHKCMQK